MKLRKNRGSITSLSIYNTIILLKNLFNGLYFKLGHRELRLWQAIGGRALWTFFNHLQFLMYICNSTVFSRIMPDLVYSWVFGQGGSKRARAEFNQVQSRIKVK